MAYEAKDMEGALFVAKERPTERHPNLTGKLMIDGKLYWLSAWKNAGKNGQKDWLSIKATAADEQDGHARSGRTTRQEDDDIPF